MYLCHVFLTCAPFCCSLGSVKLRKKGKEEKNKKRRKKKVSQRSTHTNTHNDGRGDTQAVPHRRQIVAVSKRRVKQRHNGFFGRRRV